MAADALEESGLKVTSFPEQLLTKFSDFKAKNLLLPVLSGNNPLDLTAEATGKMFELALSTILEETGIGGAVVIASHHAPTIFDDAVEMISQAAQEHGKPVTVCDIGGTEMAIAMRAEFEKRGIPSYEVPERAARALWALVYYGTYLRDHGVLRAHASQITQ